MGIYVDRYSYDVRSQELVDKEISDYNGVVAKIYDVDLGLKIVYFLNTDSGGDLFD